MPLLRGMEPLSKQRLLKNKYYGSHLDDQESFSSFFIIFFNSIGDCYAKQLAQTHENPSNRSWLKVIGQSHENPRFNGPKSTNQCQMGQLGQKKQEDEQT